MNFLDNMRGYTREEAYKKKKTRSKKTILISAVTTMAVLVALIAVTYNLTRGMKVEAIELQPQNIASQIAATGTVRSGMEKSYYAFTPARVSALNVKAGDTVNAGDVLASFASSDIDANVAQLKYQWETAAAAAEKGRNAINLLNTTITRLNNEISSLSKQLGVSAVSANAAAPLRAAYLSKSQEEGTAAEVLDELDGIEDLDSDTKVLFSKLGRDTASQVENALSGVYGITEEEIKNAISSALASAENKLENALVNSDEKQRKQLQLALLKQQKNILSTQVPSTTEMSHLQAAVDAAKQAYESVNAQAGELKNGWIAEFSGVVAQVNMQQGGVVPVGTPGLVIVDPNTLVVDINLGKYDAGKVKIGQSATVYVKNEAIPGTVTFVSPVALEEDETASLSCRVTVTNPDSRLIIGFDVDVDIQTAYADAALVVPLTAVQTDELGKYCYKYNPEERTAVKTYVGVGITNENNYQITAGLTFGDIVILNPPEKLYDGARVRICEPEETTGPQSGLPTALYGTTVTAPEGQTTIPAGEETTTNKFNYPPATSAQPETTVPPGTQGTSSIDL